jgi:hypothetical protein
MFQHVPTIVELAGAASESSQGCRWPTNTFGGIKSAVHLCNKDDSQILSDTLNIFLSDLSNSFHVPSFDLTWFDPTWQDARRSSEDLSLRSFLLRVLLRDSSCDLQQFLQHLQLLSLDVSLWSQSFQYFPRYFLLITIYYNSFFSSSWFIKICKSPRSSLQTPNRTQGLMRRGKIRWAFDERSLDANSTCPSASHRVLKANRGESVVTWYPWYFLPLEVGFGYPKFAMNLADTQRPKGFCLTSRWPKFCSQQVRKELERKLQQEEKEKEQLEAQGQRTQDMVGQHVARAAVLVNRSKSKSLKRLTSQSIVWSLAGL